jgi:hypothetical protein
MQGVLTSTISQYDGACPAACTILSAELRWQLDCGGVTSKHCICACEDLGPMWLGAACQWSVRGDGADLCDKLAVFRVVCTC